MSEFRSGYCAIVGRPNAGKSTLLNRLVGLKLAIATHKPQTTRDRILGVLTTDDAQVVLVDTPGLHKADGGINRHMVKTAEQALSSADVVLWMVEIDTDDARPPSKGQHHIFNTIQASKKPWILALNKVDKLPDRSRVLPWLQIWQETFNPPILMPLSAQDGDNVDELLAEVCKLLPEGPMLFDKDTVTDRTERFLSAEIIREKAILETQDELPYSIAVTIDTFNEEERFNPDDPVVAIQATVHVERDGQKRIVVGTRGKVIKKIGSRSRRDLRQLLGCRVYLELFVRVTKKWTHIEHQLREFGYDQ
jgi:GTP-binding protein Era